MSDIAKLILCLQKGKIQDKNIIDLLIYLYRDKVALYNYNDVIEFINNYKYPISLVSKDNWNDADSIIERSKLYNIHLISYTDFSYPRYLRALSDPPPLLHLRGNLNILDYLPGVSIVGTRNMTRNGGKIAERLSQYFSQNRWVIVSGLALGVDATVHNSVLKNDGMTIAVLASGLHEVTPKQNVKIGDEILSLGGAWVSEHPVDTKPQKQYFVKRNRIQVGLSAGSIIIEADEKSGTMTQAKYCIDLKRPLFAVYPDNENKLDLLSRGSIQLVNSGNAIPIKSKEDYPIVLSILEKHRDALKKIERNKQITMRI